jgi:hypothetical protein
VKRAEEKQDEEIGFSILKKTESRAGGRVADGSRDLAEAVQSEEASTTARQKD